MWYVFYSLCDMYKFHAAVMLITFCSQFSRNFETPDHYEVLFTYCSGNITALETLIQDFLVILKRIQFRTTRKS